MVDELRAGRPVRSELPGVAQLHCERSLPFLCVWREPADEDKPLVTGNASWLVGSHERRHAHKLRELVGAWSEAAVRAFGSALVLELSWGEPPGEATGEATDEAPGQVPAAPAPVPGPGPGFRIVAPRRGTPDAFLRALAESLGSVRLRRARARVEVISARRAEPEGRLGWFARRPEALHVVGLVVQPVHIDADTGEHHPLVLRTLRRKLDRALQRALYVYSRKCTTHRPAHYHELGRRVLSKAVRDVDKRLAELGNAFDVLLACTPVDADDVWEDFRRAHYESPPVFRYRPLTVDPGRLSRELWAIPVERVESPALEDLMRRKQRELGRQLTLLADRGTPRALPVGQALWGRVPAELVKQARRLLQRLPPKARDGGGRSLDGAAFAQAARHELDAYAEQAPGLAGRVEVREDLPGGLLVSRGRLLVGARSRIPASRVDALLAHEVGTHVLTHVNGGAQVLQQLGVGLDGYEALQEGLAVLSEALVGGLGPARLRLLAARVVAARSIEQDATFIDTFRLLHRTHGFAPRAAFNVSMRVHRAGGLVKDAIYLDGLRQVLGYLAAGGDLKTLYVGKLALEHIGTVEELLRRGVLRPALLLPRHLELPVVKQRLEALREGVELLDLLSWRGR